MLSLAQWSRTAIYGSLTCASQLGTQTYLKKICLVGLGYIVKWNKLQPKPSKSTVQCFGTHSIFASRVENSRKTRNLLANKLVANHRLCRTSWIRLSGRLSSAISVRAFSDLKCLKTHLCLTTSHSRFTRLLHVHEERTAAIHLAQVMKVSPGPQKEINICKLLRKWMTFNSNSEDVYLVQCKQCLIQYIGETGTSVRKHLKLQ